MKTYDAQLICPQCPGAQPRNGRTPVAVTVVTPRDIRYTCQNCGHQWATPAKWLPAP